MKLVREHINEKFTEKSDPVTDMGIGIFKKRKYSDASVAAKYIYNALPAILETKEIPGNIIYPIEYRDEKGNRKAFNTKYFYKITSFILKYVEMADNFKVGDIHPREDEFCSLVLKKLNQILLMAGYPKTKGINK